MTGDFRVGPIDHVELFVPDRCEAAEWYRRTLGLEIARDYEDWAAAEGGPLMVSSDGGSTMLALFEGQPRGSRGTAGYHRVAFRVDGPGFLRFLDRLEQSDVLDESGRRLNAESIVDHDKAYSIYFLDPYGHRYEITTYDHGYVSEHLRGRESLV